MPRRARLLFNGNESKYELLEIEFLGYLRIQQFIIIIILLLQWQRGYHDNLSPSFPIIHCPWEVLCAATSIRAELIYVRLCWATYSGMPMWWLPQKNVTYEFIFASPAVPSVFYLPHTDGLCDMEQVAIQLFSRGVLYTNTHTHTQWMSQACFL